MARRGCVRGLPEELRRQQRLPQPAWWGRYAVDAQRGDPGSFLRLYTAALAMRRDHPALGAGSMAWLEGGQDLLAFAREPGFVYAANLGQVPVAAPPFREVLLTSEPAVRDVLIARGALPPGTAAWLGR